MNGELLIAGGQVCLKKRISSRPSGITERSSSINDPIGKRGESGLQNQTIHSELASWSKKRISMVLRVALFHR
jgi:hypothetical protein